MSTNQPDAQSALPEQADAAVREERALRERAEAALQEEIALRRQAEASLRRSMAELSKVEALVHELQDKLGLPRSEFKDPRSNS